MKERAIVATIAASIASVKTDVRKGEKVFNAYMIFVSIRFELLLVGWCVGSAVLSLCSSVVNRNEWGLTSSRHEGSIYAQKKVSSFFLTFFFVGVWARGCGCSSVGARVWVLGCGCSSVGAWGGGMGMGRAGWRRDRDGAGWIARQDVAGESSSQGVPIPDSDCRLGCDR